MKSIAKDDIESLRDRPVRLGENDGIDGVTLSKRKVGKQIGVSELERVYGQLKNNETTAEASGEQAERVNDNHQNLPMNGNETHHPQSVNGNDREVIALLENQIQDLKAQLTQASDRENTLVGEKSKLLDMLSAEQEKTRVLMLPAPKKNASWWGYFRLKR